jgi:hypothetical protein
VRWGALGWRDNLQSASGQRTALGRRAARWNSHGARGATAALTLFNPQPPTQPPTALIRHLIQTKVGVPRAQRVQYARDILQKELLPHVGQGQYCETKKAYYIGYMVGWVGGWMGLGAVDGLEGVNSTHLWTQFRPPPPATSSQLDACQILKFSSPRVLHRFTPHPRPTLRSSASSSSPSSGAARTTATTTPTSGWTWGGRCWRGSSGAGVGVGRDGREGRGRMLCVEGEHPGCVGMEGDRVAPSSLSCDPISFPPHSNATSFSVNVTHTHTHTHTHTFPFTLHSYPPTLTLISPHPSPPHPPPSPPNKGCCFASSARTSAPTSSARWTRGKR